MKTPKILLTAINAKYIHSNLAIRYLKQYAEKNTELDILTYEFTINQYVSDILKEIFKIKPDIICFSCYIWNIEMVEKLIKLIRISMPDVEIMLGGPEVSYHVHDVFFKLMPDYIIFGEGEKTFLNFILHVQNNNSDYSDILGFAYSNGKNIFINPPQKSIDLSELPFPYTDSDFTDLRNKIIYYEASRGCPFSCQYCLSSVENGVRFSQLDKVKSELKIFLDKKISQVKFVDRTFNCKKDFAAGIIKFIIDNDNGITNFHFEMAADLIDDSMISLLKSSRKGLFQLEIGVQSTNKDTLKAICRNSEFEQIAHCVNQLKSKQNIHIHLDLITGLPHEDFESFRRSFNDVHSLKPHQLQLGFLKVLKGSGMEMLCNKYNIISSPYPPYEVISTHCLTFDEVLQLKDIEDIVEIYYNSNRFVYSTEYLIKNFKTPFDFYKALSDYKNKICEVPFANSKHGTYAYLLQFAQYFGYDTYKLKWIIKLDMLLSENMKTNPDWLSIKDYRPLSQYAYDFLAKNDGVYSVLPEYKDVNPKQLIKLVHIEHFPFNPVTLDNVPVTFLFNYRKTDIWNNASMTELNL